MLVEVLAALGEPTRLEAMRILWDHGEHCACELMARLPATQSRVSRHMQVLKRAGLVTDRRDAQWVRYRVSRELSPEIERILSAVMAAETGGERSAA